jgi:hypothetical protein
MGTGDQGVHLVPVVMGDANHARGVLGLGL